MICVSNKFSVDVPDLINIKVRVIDLVAAAR